LGFPNYFTTKAQLKMKYFFIQAAGNKKALRGSGALEARAVGASRAETSPFNPASQKTPAASQG